jgi:hypothetical protein
MLVKILDADPDFVDELKAATQSTTASKAYAKAASSYSFLQHQIDALRLDNARYERELLEAHQTIQRARSAAAQLLEYTSQGDLLCGRL